MGHSIRVVVAEDSVFTRKLLVKILETDSQIKVVGVAKNGQEAVELARRLRPDVITMDIRMPVMDGFQATQVIMSENPTPILVISSSISSEELKISFNAIQAGALDIIEKPRGNLQSDYRIIGAEIIRRVKIVSEIRVFRHLSPRLVRRIAWPEVPEKAVIEDQAVAIGASTGGPSALLQLFRLFPAVFPASVFVTQHISEGFGAGCVEWLGRNAALPVKVAEGGEKIRPGVVYFAPDRGLLGVRGRKEITIRRSRPQERMPIDSMICSVAEAYREKTIGVLLTGMGNDGVEGLLKIKALGGETIVQDEKSSIVFGMPKAAIERGVTDQVLSLEDILPAIMRLLVRQEEVRGK